MRWLKPLMMTALAITLFAGACADSEVGPGTPIDAAGDATDDVADGAAADADTGLDWGPDTGRECLVAENCPPTPQATASCTEDFQCTYTCDEGFVNVDDELRGNGCECEITNEGMEICDGSDNDCDGQVDEGFAKMSDPNNCGMCGNTCDAPNAMTACQAGSCALVGCDQGWKDCDGQLANGCEVHVAEDDDNCGSCGNVCTSQNGQTTCTDGECTIDSCMEGYDDCNDIASDGCEAQTASDPMNCGACGKTCTGNHTTSSGCRSGSCFIGGCEEGWEDCDADLANGCEQNTSSSTSHCGGCGNVCSVPNARSICKMGNCEFERCKQGYHDLNGMESDGCEYACTVTAQVDVPDAQGTDENCDGIDGMRNESVFVATQTNGGNNTHVGKATDKPVATIAKAISIAEKCQPTCDVLISAGVYDESVTLKSGVDLYGGYSASDWDRDISANQTVIRGQSNRAVKAVNLTQKTEFDGLTVEGKDYRGNGQSTYGVWVDQTGSQNLKIDYARIEAGNGGDGRDGSDGSDGGNGSDGRRASGHSGGAGGSAACGADGGDGGRAWNCGSSDGRRGSAGGDSTGGGAGGRAGNDECGNSCNDEAGNASAGSNGRDGTNGSAGTAPADADGSFNGSGLWTGKTGSSGNRGRNGRGGGGGGAGGSDNDDMWWCSGGVDVGGGGGGGGAGGCGGKPGQPGQPGGASFGIVLRNSVIDMENTTVVLGNGGDGGNGGEGGDGGTGGNGQSGAGGDSEAGDGRRGADGGEGGGAGGGAGACGGPAVGLATIGSGQAMSANVNYKSGAAGAAGQGGQGGFLGGNTGNARAKKGGDGCTGTKANTLSY